LICEIIESNNRSLKVLDLRWNELGEIGAQSIYRSLAYNSNLKYIGLEDNRISMQSLRQIEEMMKNVTRGTKEATGLRDNRMNRTQPAGWVGNVSGL
jgi:demethoxyubiquinone hydroxylase (CLK1/Coq7/Cat5 family)